MATVTYRPAPVLHWFETGAQHARTSAKKKGRELAKTSADAWAEGLKKAASAAADLGRSAFSDFVHRAAEEVTFVLHEDSFEAQTLGNKKKVIFDEVTEVAEAAHDRYVLTHKGGTLVIKPTAHLVAGRLKVPVGWTRNGMEVPYTMLIDEIAARSGVDILSK